MTMKRRQARDRDEADAREAAERRREDLLADLKAREAARREPPPADAPAEPESAPAGPDETPEEPPVPASD
jgi:hypothetical protein